MLGFRHAWGPFGAEKVTSLVHPSGLEINLIVNAKDAVAPNVLMDVPEKYAGYTHVALKIDDLGVIEAALAESGLAISGRRGQNPTKAVFVRDPDGNVIELAAD
jgi:lactoylglutathione lyase